MTRNKKNNSPLVQLVERRTVNPYVAGSSPAGGATLQLFESIIQIIKNNKKSAPT